ncbi:hypothetical protein IMCC21906_00176 [Spongiibacter sp. IMCC21906]|nr:hypothetical protein IMCC21906_00176 [Spongiibacter sp. IMCC21906]
MPGLLTHWRPAVAAIRLLICAVLLLQACGQTGPLIYPADKKAETNKNSAPNASEPNSQERDDSSAVMPSSSQ